MRLGKKCLVSSISFLLFTISLSGQEPEYIYGYGKTIREAIEDISQAFVMVSTHSTLDTKNGKENYSSYAGVDSGIIVPREGVEFVQLKDGTYKAWVRKDLIKQVDANWKVENITVTNEYHQAPYVTRDGMQVKKTTKVTSRQQVIQSPSGKKTTTQGKTTTRERTERWNGRYGSTWEINKRTKE